METTTTNDAAPGGAGTAGRTPVWLASVLAVLAAAVATELYGLAARGTGIPMAAGSIGASSAAPITVGMFAMGTVICGFWGTILAVLIARFAKHPARTYLSAAVVLTAVSLVAPLTAGDTALSTKLMLLIAHLLAAGVIIPIVTRRLAR
ncbi:MAG: hypothetical protein J2P15_12995 [Micromonosporaceae bacterium]|nr:hypothetical protein [Micromonosporaceae bacterium]